MQSDSAKNISANSGAGVGLKGSYVELVASTGFRARWCMLTVRDLYAGGSHECNFDIATGAASSESDNVLDDSNYSAVNSEVRGEGLRHYCFPVDIAASTRISVRIADDAAGANDYRFNIVLTDIVPHSTIPTTANDGSAGELAVVSGAGSDTYGSWTEVDASLGKDALWMMVSTMITVNDRQQHISFGTGAAASEVEEIKDTGGLWHAGGVSQASCYYCPVDFSSGDRISARSRDNAAGAETHKIGVVFFG